MKRNIFTFVAFFMMFALTAQQAADSKAILDKAYAAYETSQGIQLTFKSTTTETDGTVYAPQSGTAKIKGNRFKIDTEPMEIWFDGTTQWVWMKEVNEVNVSNPTGEEIAAISPLALLGMYKQGYRYQPATSKTVNGKKCYLIEMIATSPDAPFKTISVAVDKNTHSVVQVILKMKENLTTQIDIGSYNANYKFEDNAFVYDKSLHPDVEIIDLR